MKLDLTREQIRELLDLVHLGGHVRSLARDLLEDYATRKKIPLPEAEKWLSPYLDYDPV